MCAKFWWAQINNERKIHWLSWDKLSLPKAQGGMGFRNLRACNMAMLAKQGWKLLKEPDSLLHRCLKARYFPRCNFLEAQDCHNSSYTWKSILAAKPILTAGTCWRVGNGDSIRVCHDNCLPHHPSKRVLQPPPSLDRDMRVSELIDFDVHGWNRPLILQLFSIADASAILNIPLSYRLPPDTLFWLHSKNGCFSVKSGYHVASQLVREDNWAESSTSVVGQSLWKKLLEAEDSEQSEGFRVEGVP